MPVSLRNSAGSQVIGVKWDFQVNLNMRNDTICIFARYRNSVRPSVHHTGDPCLNSLMYRIEMFVHLVSWGQILQSRVQWFTRTMELNTGTPVKSDNLNQYAAITGKLCEIGQKLVSVTNVKSTMAFDRHQIRWLCVTLNGTMAVIIRYFRQNNSLLSQLC